MSKLSKGDLVIVNECDRPNPELVAVVMDVSEGLASCKYLSAKCPHHQTMVFPETTPTRLEDFGVKGIVGRFQFIVISTGKESVAKYEGGRTRRWQCSDPMDHTQPLKEQFWDSPYYRPPVEYSRGGFNELVEYFRTEEPQFAAEEV